MKKIQKESERLPKVNPREQPKQKRDDRLWPEEEKVTKLYKAGNLTFKTFENAEDFIKYLNP